MSAVIAANLPTVAQMIIEGDFQCVDQNIMQQAVYEED